MVNRFRPLCYKWAVDQKAAFILNAGVDKRLAPEKRIGLALRARRESLGWSQETLAFESGLHWTYIGAVERGEKDVTPRNAIPMAKAMRVALSEILIAAGL